MRKSVTLAISALFAATAVCIGSGVAAAETKIGCSIFTLENTFLKSLHDYMETEAEDLHIKLTSVSADYSQPKQHDQVDSFLEQGNDALVIVPVDGAVAFTLVDKVQESDTPLIFVNREPNEKTIKRGEKVYYIGSRSEGAGRILAEMVINYFHTHPEADKNGDGKVQYILLRGEEGNIDDKDRTTYFQKGLEEAGVGYEVLAVEHANWMRAQGKSKMQNFLSFLGPNQIEVVVANNDDMALGAIEALETIGYNTKGDTLHRIPVVGVDATQAGLQAIHDGQLLGTALQDSRNMARAALLLGDLLSHDRPVTHKTYPYAITNERYVWIPYVLIDKTNYAGLLKK